MFFNFLTNFPKKIKILREKAHHRNPKNSHIQNILMPDKPFQLKVLKMPSNTHEMHFHYHLQTRFIKNSEARAFLHY